MMENGSRDPKRVMICVGGTGGHVFPAEALSQQLRKAHPDVEFLFVGGGLDSNPFFDRKGLPFRSVPCAPINMKTPLKALRNCLTNLRGVWQSWRAIRGFRPDAAVGFGSFHSLPPLLAAKVSSIPMVLHEGNRIPGRVNRLFSRAARVTGVHFPDTVHKLRGRAIEVGMPLREGYSRQFSSRQKAMAYFHLNPDKFTFMVIGGSQGALTINTLFCGAMIEFVDRTKNFQVLHFTGSQAAAEEIQDLYDELGICAHVKDFEKRMDYAWLAADLAVTRAGAMTLAEMLEYEVPALLIPYPHAMDDHQTENAQFLVHKVGGAVSIAEDDLTPETFASTIYSLLSQERKNLNAMKDAIRQHKQKVRHRDLCSLVCEVAGMKVR